MSKFLNVVGIIGAICMLLGFVTLDSTGVWEKVSAILSIVGIALIVIWLETEGRRFA